MIFDSMNVMDEIKKAVDDMGFTELTSIQEETMPLIMAGHDIIGQSQTGTGKTAAFVIPILHKIDAQLRKPQVLILCPTRELSVQVANEFRKLTKYMPSIRTVAIYGGEPISRQIMALRSGVQVIIGTPGRTIDHIQRRTIRLDMVNTVILDEADEMLKMGFREDIELILGDVPEERQTILFSATMPKSILDITNQYQKNPQLVKVKATTMTADTIEQEYCEVNDKHKTEALCRILDVNKPNRCIVFCNKKRIVDDVADALMQRGYIAEKIHGDLKQELRINVLNKFNQGKLDVLVATDVAARGLDIQEVDLIINYDVPDKEEYYVHRIGRSGRAGKKGRSITLVTRMERRMMQDIMHYTKKAIDKHSIPTIDQVNESNIDKFLEEVVQLADTADLEKYVNILQKVDRENHSIEKIAAVLIKMNIELHENSEFNDINVQFTDYRRDQAPRYGNDRGGDRGGYGARPSRPAGAGTGRPNKNREGMVRMFINVGRKDEVKPSHILGAIVGECGIVGSNVGAIDVLDKFSFVDVHEDVAQKVLKKMKNAKIRDKKINIEIASGAK